MKSLRIAVLLILAVSLLAGCGGGGASLGTSGGASSSSGGGTVSSSNPPSGSNVQPISVNLGPNYPASYAYPNGIFTSVTVCTPGTSTCQTIPNVLVDTGSYGLRLLGSAVSISLPQQTTSAGNTGECLVFVDSYVWGPVVTADIQMGGSNGNGETASNVPVQIIGAYSSSPSSFPSTNPPQACTQAAQTAATEDGDGGGATPQNDDTLYSLGANGILGIGPFAQDCGAYCSSTVDNDQYFNCSSSSVCTSMTQSLQTQVENPVALFASDNNGVQIQLPAISGNGAATASGVMVFGIGTQTNNPLGSANVLTVDDNNYLTTKFNGSSYVYSYVDSGTPILGFADSSILQCSGEDLAGLYCPNSTLNLSASMIGQNNTSVTVPFSVANANTLLSGSNAAFNDLAGTSGGGTFAWGLPFFFGRNVYFAIAGETVEGAPTPPFVAY